MSELADVFAELEDPHAANTRRHSLYDNQNVSALPLLLNRPQHLL